MISTNTDFIAEVAPRSVCSKRIIIFIPEGTDFGYIKTIINLFDGLDYIDSDKKMGTIYAKFTDETKAVYAREKLHGFLLNSGGELKVQYMEDLKPEQMPESLRDISCVPKTSERIETNSRQLSEKEFKILFVCHHVIEEDLLKNLLQKFVGFKRVFTLEDKSYSCASFETEEDALHCIKILHGKLVQGKELKVLSLEPKKIHPVVTKLSTKSPPKNSLKFNMMEENFDI